MTLTVSVRVRDGDDRVSLSCQQAAEYVRQNDVQKKTEQLREPVHSPVTSSPPAPALTLKSPTVINYGSAASKTNGAADHERNGATSYNGATKPPTSTIVAPTPPKQLVIRVREGTDADKDRGLMDDLKRMLLEHQGDDEIALEIVVDGRLITME